MGQLSFPDQQAYNLFYEWYGPKLWGIILLANLPLSESERILMNTILKAWRQQDQYPLTGNYVLARLINLAYSDGLPRERVVGILKSVLK